MHEKILTWLWRNGHKASATAYSIPRDLRANIQAFIVDEFNHPNSYILINKIYKL
ncbi:hypothetical protein Lser_V15G06867 [Lactuca serriola]